MLAKEDTEKREKERCCLDSSIQIWTVETVKNSNHISIDLIRVVSSDEKCPKYALKTEINVDFNAQQRWTKDRQSFEFGDDHVLLGRWRNPDLILVHSQRRPYSRVNVNDHSNLIKATTTVPVHLPVNLPIWERIINFMISSLFLFYTKHWKTTVQSIHNVSVIGDNSHKHLRNS